MKVLHVINSLKFGGAEKLLVDSLPLYINNGIDASVLTLNAEKTPFCDSLEKNNITIHKINTPKSLYNPLHIFRLVKYFKSFDIIHVHLFPALYWVSIASLLAKKKTKIILTEHNTENKRRNIFIFKLIDALIYKRFSKIIAISRAAETNLKKHLNNKSTPCITINNGIDLEIIRKEQPYKKSVLGLDDASKIIIQVSSFTAQKDQNTLIKSMVHLPNHVHLLLVGDGPLKENAIELSKKLNLTDRIQFLGYRSDVPKLVKTANISVLSSHYEGFGLAIVEGMAAGNACIGSNVPGLSEIVEGAGILFKSGDENELKDHLLKLIENEIYYKKIALQCSNKAKHYDIKTMIEKYINVYNTINS